MEIYIDWKNKKIYTDTGDLFNDLLNVQVECKYENDFEAFLTENYSILDIFYMCTKRKEQIKSDFLENNFEEIIKQEDITHEVI